MRFARPAAWCVAVLLWLALGPLVVVLVAVLLVVPRTRGLLRPDLPGRRTATAMVTVAAIVGGGIWVLPDGWLPVPPGGGAWVTPTYTGRPFDAQSLTTTTSDSDRPGPLGLSVEVDSAWFGAEHCAHLLPDPHERLAALCTSRSGARLKVIDPRSLRPLATEDLPDPCADVSPVLDPAGRLVVATGDRRLLTVGTADGADEPALVTEDVVDLSGVVGEGDCVVAVVIDGTGRAWFATGSGRVGVLREGKPVTVDLGEPISQPLAADRDGVYVTTDRAVHRLVTRAGAPLESWRAAYETGSGPKSGQRDGGSGSGAVLFGDGLLALTDNANPRMHVVVLRAADGGQVCRAEVFEDDASATEAALTVVEDGVVVTNAHGWSGVWRGALGRRPEGGIARIGTDCETSWTSEEVAPTSGTTLSTSSGLLYAWTKRGSWLGVDAWYLTAIDARTGRTIWSVRAGTGVWADDDGAPITIGPGEAAFVGTRAGLVRIADGTRGLRGLRETGRRSLSPVR